jgi:NADH-quinone oxidoreductase subunit J
MNPGLLLFYFFAAVAVVGGIMMVTRRNAVHSAVYLVLTFVSISAIYVLLGAEFLFAVQVLVYAGGIMVLFLFVIMLVNLEEPRRFSGGRLHLGLSTILSLLLFAMLALVFVRNAPKVQTVTPNAQFMGGLGNIEAIGMGLYRYYLLPFEAVSLLLLVAMIGAIVLARPRI